MAAAVFCGVLILMIKFFLGSAMPMPTAFAGLAVMILVTQLVVILTPALLMTIMLTKRPAGRCCWPFRGRSSWACPRRSSWPWRCIRWP